MRTGRITAAGLLGTAGAVAALSACGGSGGQPHPTAPAVTVTQTVPAPPSAVPVPADSSSVPSGGPDMQSMGGQETLTSAGTGAAVGTLVISSLHITTYPADGTYGSRPLHGYYVTVNATAAADPANTSGWDVSPSDFYALAGAQHQHYAEGDGNSYDALPDISSELGYATTLAAGETGTGKLVFDVSSRHGEIVYSPNSDGQPIAEWSY